MSRNRSSESNDPALEREVLEVGGRLDQAPSELLVKAAFQQELDDQIELSCALNQVDLAHTLVMMKSGVIPGNIGEELLGGLLLLGKSPTDFVPDAFKGDLYTNREAWLKQHNYPSDWLGAGRARREAITTAFLIFLREKLLILFDRLLHAGRSMIAKAEAYADACMPDYTYWQAAQVSTFGHYLLGFVYPMLRDLDRLRAFFDRCNACPAGCGSGNGSRLPQNREELSRLLGFEGLVSHGRDAVWQADLALEAAAILASITINLDRLAEDLQIFVSEEFALIDFADRHARASKIMPHKKNPFALTHVRGLANAMIGTLTTTAAMGRTSSGQPDNRLRLYGLLPRAFDDTAKAVDLMGEFVDCMLLDRELARNRVENSFVLATDLAEVMVQECGLSFRDAHRLVGCLVREYQLKHSFAGLTAKTLATKAFELLGREIVITEQALTAALNSDESLISRTEIGSAAPRAMTSMVDECRFKIKEAEVWKQKVDSRLSLSDLELSHAVEALLAQAKSINLRSQHGNVKD